MNGFHKKGVLPLKSWKKIPYLFSPAAKNVVSYEHRIFPFFFPDFTHSMIENAF